jgi:hypothetical protein
VWAHLAEFPAYWLEQARHVVAGRKDGQAEPVSFGRTKTDPVRIAAIQGERRTDPAELLRRVQRQLSEVRAAASAFTDADWATRGRHPTRGQMRVGEIMEEYIVRHLEEHAAQLDGLAHGGTEGA